MGAGGKRVRAVDDVSLRVGRGESVALVGESGCGKSITSLAIAGLLPPGQVEAASGSVVLDGQDLLSMRENELNSIRGRRIGMVFQDPFHALNPAMTIGKQVGEGIRHHLGLRGPALRERVTELLASVGIPQPRRVADAYPHELSGGMQQRVGIAIALGCEPELLIADEPTTALDVTVQMQIMDLLAERTSTQGVGLLLVSHDMGVVAGLADRTYVMYAGRIVETAETAGLFRAPHHHYTQGLLASVPTLDSPVDQPLPAIGGEPPLPGARGNGCSFAPRCAGATALCTDARPELTGEPVEAFACWHPLNTSSAADANLGTETNEEQ